MFFYVLNKSFYEQLISLLVLNLHEGMACSNILSNCPVTLMFLQEKSRNEACLVLFLKLAAAYSIYLL